MDTQVLIGEIRRFCHGQFTRLSYEMTFKDAQEGSRTPAGRPTALRLQVRERVAGGRWMED
jgi:hypothetical protein